MRQPQSEPNDTHGQSTRALTAANFLGALLKGENVSRRW
jgi:hypothetical protein